MLSLELKPEEDTYEWLYSLATSLADKCNNILPDLECHLQGFVCPLGRKTPCTKVTFKDWLEKFKDSPHSVSKLQDNWFLSRNSDVDETALVYSNEIMLILKGDHEQKYKDLYNQGVGKRSLYYDSI